MESPGHLSGHATIASIDLVIQVKTIYMSANNSKRPKLQLSESTIQTRVRYIVRSVNNRVHGRDTRCIQIGVIPQVAHDQFWNCPLKIQFLSKNKTP